MAAAVAKPAAVEVPADDTIGAILVDTYNYIDRFMILTSDEKVIISLWVAHTHVFECFEQSPYLVIRAPEKQSGKTRLLEVLEQLVFRPWMVTRPSEAVLFRKVDSEPPTLLLDEVDAIFKAKQDEKAEALRAILDSGNREGVSVPRCVGGSHAVRDFSVYCPKALAGIGAPPDTIADRAWSIFLKRKTHGEKVERYRRREASVRVPAETLNKRLRAWAGQTATADALRNSWPELPDSLSDRGQDNAESLLAIADLAGGEWPARARAAVVNTFSRQSETESGNSLTLQALIDCKTVFGELGQDRISPEVIVDRLKRIEGPWGDDDRKLTAHKLAFYLKQYEIKSKARTIAGHTTRGYDRADFQDAWERWCPDHSVPSAAAPPAAA